MKWIESLNNNEPRCRGKMQFHSNCKRQSREHSLFSNGKLCNNMLSIMRYIFFLSCWALSFSFVCISFGAICRSAGTKNCNKNNGMQAKWLMMMLLLMMTSQLVIIKAIVMDLNGSSGICNVGNVQLCHITRWNYWYESANNNKTRLDDHFPWM